MSLLHTCQQALTKCVPVRVAVTQVRPYTESSVIPSGEDKSQVLSRQPQEVITADVVSGAPEELRHRTVRIYKPTRNTMQSGSAKTDNWRIDWDILQGAGRWQNPLMGWASSADYMQGTRLTFRTKEDAMHFAEKQGWDYFVQQPTVARIPPKNYAENYVYNPDKLRIAKTK